MKKVLNLLLQNLQTKIKSLFVDRDENTTLAAAMRKKNTSVLDGNHLLRPLKFIKIPAAEISYKNLDDYNNVNIIRKLHPGKGIIYGIVNNLNNKIYIGSTTNWDMRIGCHLTSHNTKQSNINLQNSIKEYGRSNFSLHIFKVVELTTDLTLKQKKVKHLFLKILH